MKKWLLAPLAAAALCAGPAAAQRTIVPGELTRGALSTDDPRLRDDTYYDDWVFEGRRGETVIVSMDSRAFDAFLHLGVVRRGRYEELATDDDGGNGTDSRLEYRLPEDGTYVIRANSLSEDTGPYTLTLVGGRRSSGGGGGWYDRDQVDRYPSGGRDGWVTPGRPVRDRLEQGDATLDNGAFFHLYRYEGRRGERLTVDLRSSDFDAYLVIGTPGGRHGVETALMRDDDGGDDRNSRIVYTLPNDGEYVIRVNSVLPASGEYTLDVRSSDRQGGYSGSGVYQNPNGVYRDRDDRGDYDTGRGGTLRAGRTVRGRLSSGDPTLDNGAFFHLYRYEGRRGERVTLTLRSTDFDAYLVLGTEGGRHGIETALVRDDDGAGGRDSRISFTLPYDGEYVVRVNSVTAGSGSYTLEVDSNY
ncbi:MAG TPA: PPC domain-containing protein [Longimicrobium sp.]|nr:PPC domain-containing protein [Longimicrobium sp.]